MEIEARDCLFNPLFDFIVRALGALAAVYDYSIRAKSFQSPSSSRAFFIRKKSAIVA